jgi:hypothetical protein
MFTLYRSKWERGGFRAVAGAHLPLVENDFTRHDFPGSREAFLGCKNDAERKVVLLIDPNADKAGTWVRTDKGDGEETTVTRDQLLEALTIEHPKTDATALRKAVMKAETSRTELGREKVTKFATFFFKLREG